jgi:hypothetical protein
LLDSLKCGHSEHHGVALESANGLRHRRVKRELDSPEH